jgi:hypothetical protein
VNGLVLALRLTVMRQPCRRAVVVIGLAVSVGRIWSMAVPISLSAHRF